MATKKSKLRKPVSKIDARIDALFKMNDKLMQHQLALQYVVECVLANEWAQPGFSLEVAERWSLGMTRDADKELQRLVSGLLEKALDYAKARRPPGGTTSETMQ